MPEGMRNAYKILVSDLKERYHFGGIGISKNTERPISGYGPMAGCLEHGYEPSYSIKEENV